ncbi:hypothetical protein MTO96_030792 [Rhipicephalus appendiculatus]
MVFLRMRTRRIQGGSKCEKRKRQNGQIPFYICEPRKHHHFHKHPYTRSLIPDSGEESTCGKAQKPARINDRLPECSSRCNPDGLRIFHDRTRHTE